MSAVANRKLDRRSFLKAGVATAGGLFIGLASGLAAVFFPAASEAVIYVMMAVVLLIRPRGLFGEEGMMS